MDSLHKGDDAIDTDFHIDTNRLGSCGIFLNVARHIRTEANSKRTTRFTTRGPGECAR